MELYMSVRDLTDNQIISDLTVMPFKDFCKKHSCTFRTINNILDERDLKDKIQFKSSAKKLITPDKLEELIKEYRSRDLTYDILKELLSKYSYKTISKIYGCTDCTVRNIAIRNGLVSPTLEHDKKPIRHDIGDLPSKEELTNLLKEIPTKDVATNYNVTSKAIVKWCDRLGIDYDAIQRDKLERKGIINKNFKLDTNRLPFREDLLEIIKAGNTINSICTRFKVKPEYFINQLVKLNIPIAIFDINKTIRDYLDSKLGVEKIGELLEMSHLSIALVIKKNNLSMGSTKIFPDKKYAIKVLKMYSNYQKAAEYFGLSVEEFNIIFS